MKRILSRTLLALAAIVVLGMLIPQNLKMPVVEADNNSYNHDTFWYEGWGTSIVLTPSNNLSDSDRTPRLLILK